jgi:phospholipid/cholesterol/gamma-HCH transport system substrate-binding protein
VNQVNQGNGLLTKLITDSTFADTFEKALNDIATTGNNAKIMSSDLKAIISKLDNKNSAVGVLLTDTLFAKKLRVTLGNAESASVKLDQNMEALQHNFLLRGYFRKKEKAEAATK